MGTRGIGGGLAATGLQQEQNALGMLGKAADAEQERSIGNARMETARKAGNTQLGVAGGAMLGFQMGGPMGALVGGVLGAVGAELF